MKYRNLEKKAANLNTKWGGQRSQANSVAFSPDGSDKVSRRSHSCISSKSNGLNSTRRLGQGFPKKAFSKPSKSNGLISAGKRGDPCFCLGYRPSPLCNLFPNSIGLFLEGAMNGT